LRTHDANLHSSVFPEPNFILLHFRACSSRSLVLNFLLISRSWSNKIFYVIFAIAQLQMEQIFKSRLLRPCHLRCVPPVRFACAYMHRHSLSFRRQRATRYTSDINCGAAPVLIFLPKRVGRRRRARRLKWNWGMRKFIIPILI
jgi:hypothetical protein